MKNFIIVALVVLVPIFAYIVLDGKKHSDIISVAEAGNKPTVIIFSANMCSECQKYKKMLAEVEPKYSDKVDFVKIKAGSEDAKTQEMVRKYMVLLVPTSVFVDKKGAVKYRVEGFISKQELEQKLKVIING